MKGKNRHSSKSKNNSLDKNPVLSIDSLPPKIKSSMNESFESLDNIIFVTSIEKLNIHGEVYENSIFAMSLSKIGIFSEKSKDNMILRFFNVLELSKFTLFKNKSNNPQLSITVGADDILFLSGPILQISRLIFRNYTFATISLPKALRITFETYDEEIFPLYKIPLSIAQIFQFRYYALCAQNNVEYDHSIVQYFHSLVKSRDTLFNLKHLPNKFNPRQMKPIFQSLTFIPIIYGISCKDSDTPTIFSDVASLLQSTLYIRYLKLINCNATKGIKELSKAISSNPNLPLEQLFFNDNEIDDASLLIEALSKLESNLTHLSLTNCGLDEDNFELLCDALLNSKSLKELKYLGIGGAELSDKAIKLLSKYIKENDKLETLDLSGSSTFGQILRSISKSSIKELKLADCDFDDESVEQLNYLAQNINSLDISGSNLNFYEVSDILAAFGRNQKDLLTIKINKLNFSKDRSFSILRGFMLNDFEKWKSIEMDETQISSTELLAYQALFLRMINLEYLSLSSNFQEADAENVSKLLEIKSLKSLNLANSQCSSIIPQIIKSNLKSINLSSNELTDKDAIKLLSSENFECVKLNDNSFSDFGKIVDIANNNPNLNTSPLKHGLSTILKPNAIYSELIANVINKFNTSQHSSINEDLLVPYPFPETDHDSETLDIGDPEMYDLPNINTLAIESNYSMQKIKKVSIYPPIEVVNNPQFEVEDQSEVSIDELMNTNLIPTLSDTMFAGLGGSISDSSVQEKEKSTHKINKQDDILDNMDSPSLAPGDYQVPIHKENEYDTVNSMTNSESVPPKPLHDFAPPLSDSEKEEESDNINKSSFVSDSDDGWVTVSSNPPVDNINVAISKGTPKRMFSPGDSEVSSPEKEVKKDDNKHKGFDTKNSTENSPKQKYPNNKKSNTNKNMFDDSEIESSDSAAMINKRNEKLMQEGIEEYYSDDNDTKYNNTQQNRNIVESKVSSKKRNDFSSSDDESDQELKKRNNINKKNDFGSEYDYYSEANIQDNNISKGRESFGKDAQKQKRVTQKKRPSFDSETESESEIEKVNQKGKPQSLNDKMFYGEEEDESNENEQDTYLQKSSQQKQKQTSTAKNKFNESDSEDIPKPKPTPTPPRSPSTHKSKIPGRGSTTKSSKKKLSDSDEIPQSPNSKHKSRLPTPNDLRQSPGTLRKSNDDFSKSPSGHKSRIPGIRNQSPSKPTSIGKPHAYSKSDVEDDSSFEEETKKKQTPIKENVDKEISNDTPKGSPPKKQRNFFSSENEEEDENHNFNSSFDDDKKVKDIKGFNNDLIISNQTESDLDRVDQIQDNSQSKQIVPDRKIQMKKPLQTNRPNFSPEKDMEEDDEEETNKEAKADEKNHEVPEHKKYMNRRLLVSSEYDYDNNSEEEQMFSYNSTENHNLINSPPKQKNLSECSSESENFNNTNTKNNNNKSPRRNLHHSDSDENKSARLGENELDGLENKDNFNQFESSESFESKQPVKFSRIPSIPKIGNQRNQGTENMPIIQSPSDSILEKHPSLSEEAAEIMKSRHEQKMKEKRLPKRVLNDFDTTSSEFQSQERFTDIYPEEEEINEKAKQPTNKSTNNQINKPSKNSTPKKISRMLSESSDSDSDAPKKKSTPNSHKQTSPQRASKSISIKIEPPKPSPEESLKSIQDFISFTSSLFQIQKRKKHKNQVNPLMLAFSPPVLVAE
ncbi:hypothetical protein TRFO_05979 [Tritrichomonas foetus]|uniref:Leucine Rich Repeat family protein n=1 Tax=Tritrichomonas foetus TaxID=1144522 RepID=A0A1J4K1R9_9EUKA|nr:hypothetical protein TRFO_05979 [Tritrichomonas foetus]|eukprot:OHT05385.1 hypothetical protein TRFO_05979 [Tritrichomonas foetus]